jgi:tetratricopeptide (TPR) repeat protein
MGKYKKSDIVIKSPGQQIREKIIEKFGSVKNFADQIGMYDSSVEQYLTTRSLGSTTFKIRLTNEFQKSLSELYLTDEAQIRMMTLSISEDISSYNQHKDIEVLEKIKDICIKRELLEDYAIVCRSYAIFFYNQLKIDRALAYMQLAVNYLRGKESTDRFAIYLSELIKIEAEISLRSRINKLTSECLLLIDQSDNIDIVCKVFTNIGLSLLKMGDYDDAERYFLKIIDIQESDQNVAFVLQLIGDINIIRGNYSKAFNNYSEAEKLLWQSDELMPPLNHRFAVYYNLLEEYQLAEKYIDLVLSKTKLKLSATDNKYLVTMAEIKMHFGKNHEVLIEIKNLLEELKKNSIYAVRHIKQLEKIVELYRTDLAFLNKIIELLISYYNESELEQEFIDAIKIVIGRTVLETYRVNGTKRRT